MSRPELRSSRLRLRQWREADRAPFAAMNADPLSMEFLALWSREESDAAYDRIQKHWADHGFGIWVIDVEGEFAGTLGLMHPRFEAYFTPCVEIGYRMLPRFWGKGFAAEAGNLALGHGFHTLRLAEILAFTVPANVRSRRVMERLGMSHTEDFDYPEVPEGHPHRRCVLYRIAAESWRARNQ